MPTPITPINIDKQTRHITLAYFDQRSTVDYIGAVQGIPVCFDAKECNTDTFPLQNIHEHQVKFMEDFEKQGGIAFFLVSFYGKGRILLPAACRTLKVLEPRKGRRTQEFPARGTGSLLLSFGGTGRFSAVSDRIAEGFGYEGLTF